MEMETSTGDATVRALVAAGFRLRESVDPSFWTSKKILLTGAT
jgi:hypothetical protein